MGFDLTRRGFLGLLGIGAAAIAAEELIPFNRVWSIPSNVRIANIAETAAITGGSNPLLTIDMITREALRILKNKLTFTSGIAFNITNGNYQTERPRRTFRLRKYQVTRFDVGAVDLSQLARA